MRAVFFATYIGLVLTLAGCSDESVGDEATVGDSSARTEPIVFDFDPYVPSGIPPEAEKLREFIRNNPSSDRLEKNVAELYQLILAMDSLAALSSFIQEFPDFPEAEAAKAKLLQRANIDIRHTIRASQSSTENSKNIDAAAVYQIFNNSAQRYLVKVSLQGAGKKCRRTDVSGKETGVKSSSSRITEASYVLEPGLDIKAECFATEPNNFSVAITGVVPASKKFVTALRAGLEGKAKLEVVDRLLGDPRAEGWHKGLRESFNKIARKNFIIKITVGERFDPDFKSPVTIAFKNATDMPLRVNYETNFGDGGSVELSGGKKLEVPTTGLGVTEGELDVHLVNFESPGIRKAKSRFDYKSALEERRRIAVEKENEQKRIAAKRAAERKRLAKIKEAESYGLVADRSVVHDENTGLTWMRCALGQSWNGKSCTGKVGLYNMVAALKVGDKVNEKNGFAGHKDWRLPTKEELSSLVFCSNGEPAHFPKGPCRGKYDTPTIAVGAFPNTRSHFWSSTLSKYSTGGAITVDFDTGYIGAGGAANSHRVRLVR